MNSETTAALHKIANEGALSSSQTFLEQTFAKALLEIREALRPGRVLSLAEQQEKACFPNGR